VPVTKKVRSEAPAISVNISGGEFLQYLVAAASSQLSFTLRDANTHEIILSDRVPPTIESPTTITRLWPVVGDRPQQVSELVLALNFAGAGDIHTFQVQHRQADGKWVAAIDIDFESDTGGEWYHYAFRVLAE
jgi:hypothetical protein